MNTAKRVKGICRECEHSEFEGALGNNQKLICKIVDSPPHGRYPSYTLKECPAFVEASSFVKKRNAKRLKGNKR